MVHHQLASSKTRRTNLGPCHTAFHPQPPFLPNFSRDIGSHLTMETTPKDVRDERRVGGDTRTVDRSTKAVPLPNGSLDTDGLNIGAIEVTDGPQENGDSIVAAEEDGIGPDDAPEVALEDIDEEVCTLSSNTTVGGLISANSN